MKGLRLHVPVLLASVLAIYQALIIKSQPMFAALVQAADGVIMGQPHWRLFQSRILGPLFYALVRNILGLAPGVAFLAVVIVSLFAFFITIFLCTQSLSHSRSVAFSACVVAFALTSVILRHLGWFYLWDSIDLFMFSLLAYSILTTKPLLTIIVIAVETLNREVALILAICLILDALLEKYIIEERSILIGRKIIAGSLLVLLSLSVSELLRRSLLIKEVGPTLWPEIPNGRFVNMQLRANLNDLWNLVSQPAEWLNWIVVLGIPISVWYWAARFRLFSAALYFTSLWAATFVLGVAREWRVWLWSVPFFILVGAYAIGRSRPKNPCLGS